jgi:magnesium transporter
MAETNTTIVSTLETLLEKKKFNSIKDVLSTMNPADIAAVLEALDQPRLVLLFRLLPKSLAADSFVEMDGDTQEILIQGFTDKELKEIVDELYMDDAVDLVEEMPANLVKRILRQTDPETRRLINEMLKYPEDSAGSIMTTEFVDLRPEMTAAEAIDHIREAGIDSETINICYVVNKTRQLIGAVSIRSIILAKSDAHVEDIMESHVISVTTLEDQETVAQMFAKYNFTAMPVVDTEGRLVGIVTVDDAIDVIQEEATEDISKMAAITPSDKPYLRRSVFELWKSRVPWLMILMISATFTGLIITHFEDQLAGCLVLTAFIPMLMDTGGNSGSQASVTIIRSLSLQEIDFSDLFRIMWKEARVAVMCGLSLAIVNSLKLMFFDKVGFSVALVICVTLVVTVFVAKLVGCSLPLLAKKIGFDPAVMASPFITTIVDALSLLIYFRMATLVLDI